jgi:uncharacterized BrkB/YihY/UPF0761 family membrane protein
MLVNLPQGIDTVQAAWTLLRLSYREWVSDSPFRLAASVAFYTTFSFAPVLLIAIRIGSLFSARGAVIEKLTKLTALMAICPTSNGKVEACFRKKR